MITSMPNSQRPSLNISVIGLLIAPVMNTADQSPKDTLSPLPENQLSLTPSGSTQNLTTSPAKNKPKPKTPWQTRHEFAHVDNIFIVVFPTMFIIFNILYWIICLYYQDSVTDRTKK